MCTQICIYIYIYEHIFGGKKLWIIIFCNRLNNRQFSSFNFITFPNWIAVSKTYFMKISKISYLLYKFHLKIFYNQEKYLGLGLNLPGKFIRLTVFSRCPCKQGPTWERACSVWLSSVESGDSSVLTKEFNVSEPSAFLAAWLTLEMKKSLSLQLAPMLDFSAWETPQRLGSHFRVYF